MFLVELSCKILPMGKMGMWDSHDMGILLIMWIDYFTLIILSSFFPFMNISCTNCFIFFGVCGSKPNHDKYWIPFHSQWYKMFILQYLYLSSFKKYTVVSLTSLFQSISLSPNFPFFIAVNQHCNLWPCFVLASVKAKPNHHQLIRWHTIIISRWPSSEFASFSCGCSMCQLELLKWWKSQCYNLANGILSFSKWMGSWECDKGPTIQILSLNNKGIYVNLLTFPEI